jgi:hypothetical protein
MEARLKMVETTNTREVVEAVAEETVAATRTAVETLATPILDSKLLSSKPLPNKSSRVFSPSLSSILTT